MGMSAGRYRHRVRMGIALYQKYTGLGIGRAMMEKLLANMKYKDGSYADAYWMMKRL